MLVVLFSLFFSLLRSFDYQASKAKRKIATQLASNIYNIEVGILLSYLRLCGLMDKAPDFGSGDCRFESCHFQVIFIANTVMVNFTLMK